MLDERTTLVECQVSSGRGGRNQPEQVAGMLRIGWPVSAGLGGRFRPDCPASECRIGRPRAGVITSSGTDLDLQPGRSDGAMRTACWGLRAAQGRARYRSPSRRSGSGSCCRSAYTFWDTWATPDVPFCAAAGGAAAVVLARRSVRCRNYRTPIPRSSPSGGRGPVGGRRSSSSAVLRRRRGGVGTSADAGWSKTLDRPFGDPLPDPFALSIPDWYTVEYVRDHDQG